MNYSYHIEHSHEWAIGAKFVISGYDAQLVAQLAAQGCSQLADGRPVLGSIDFEWARHCVVSSVEMRPYANLLLAIERSFSI